MYPYIRAIKELIKNRKAKPLTVTGTHVSYHRCWPQDIDMFIEMNNGRIPTIMELGRFGMAMRIGLIKAIREARWGLTVAGTSIRYRKRITPFTRFKMVTKVACWDDRFVYITQSIWVGDSCAAHALFRTGVVNNHRLVSTNEVLEKLGDTTTSPPIPDWIQNWIDAEATRPWPPDAE